MAHLIDKDALVAEIEKQRQLIFPKNTGEMKVADVPKPLEQGWLNALSWMKKTIDSLEVKEVDLELITGWFDHIAQIADDRMTLTNQRMTDAHALDEIKCLAKNSSEFITKHYKAQKGE